jgi:hypothetical protein
MSKSRWLQVIALFAIIVFCTCSEIAFARSHMMLVPKEQSQVQPNTATAAFPDPGLYAADQAFRDSPYNASFPGNGWDNNSDGSELWPCFGEGGNNGDCPTIGNPATPFEGLATGEPRFTWSLASCNGTTNGTQDPYTQGETWNYTPINGYYVPCGQINTYYEDWSGDSSDDILWSAVVTQGGNVIADTGIQDWGQNYDCVGCHINFWQDFNFGTLGDVGPNNGNCVPNYNYPTTSLPSSYPVIIAAGKTCVDPVTGPATIDVTTTLATPTWTCKTTHSVTTCTVKYANKYSLHQKWNIYLR